MRKKSLYRGIRKYGKGFVHGDLIQTLDDTVYILPIEEQNGSKVMVLPETVGQFTTFKNRISNEKIFEGDLCKVILDSYYDNGNASYEEYSVVEGVVKWYDGGWFIKTNDNEHLWLYDMLDHDFEIIGNIHENK